MSFQVSLTPERFFASTRIDKIITDSSPVCFMLSMDHDLYILEKERIDEVLKELDRMSTFARIEEASSRANELLPKKVFPDTCSLALFQYAAPRLQVVAYPQLFLFRTPRSAPVYQLNWRAPIPLPFPNTNRLFSEIVEVDTRESRFLAFAFEKEWSGRSSRLEFHPAPPEAQGGNPERHAPQSEVTRPEATGVSRWYGVHDGGRITMRLEKEEARFSRYVSKLKDRMEQTNRMPGRARPVQRRTLSWLVTRIIRGDLVKYGFALLIVTLIIAGVNSAATNRFKKNESNVPPHAPITKAQSVAPELFFDQTESVSSKYLKRVKGMLPFSDSIITYQSTPNILLRVSFEKEVSPILLDSAQIGNLTRGTRFGADLLAFAHDKKGLVFLDPAERRWRLVEFTEPEIKQYTDLTSYEDFLYILDARSRQIWKLAIAEGDLTGLAWAHDARVDLAQGSHLAIDGSIYIALGGGEIVKMNAGKKDPTFHVDERVLPFGSLDALSFATTEGNLFVLDGIRERIVELTKDGELVRQYVFPAGFQATDFFVRAQTAFVLSANRVYQFPLPPNHQTENESRPAGSP